MKNSDADPITELESTLNWSRVSSVLAERLESVYYNKLPS